MKNYLVILLISLLSPYCLGQFGPRQIIDGSAKSPTMIRAGDLDGDGDLDVVSSIFNEILWYRNLDGHGSFSAPISVSSGFVQIFSIQMTDLNGDNHLDILGSSFDNATVFWFENLDGLGNFGSLQLISNSVIGALDVLSADIDGDGDLDVVSNSDGLDQLFWSENIDGLGSFAPKILITDSSNNGRSVIVGDFDGDNDMDVATSSSGVVNVAWFENLDGQGTFGPGQSIAVNLSGVEEIHAVDLDNDGDLDMIASNNSNNRIGWFENIDGLGNFGPQNIITNLTDGVRSIYAADLDNDGDPDVLSASSIDEKIAWYENLDGLGSFGPQQILETEAAGSRSVIAADIDNDGDNDVLGTLRIDDTLTWYENLTILGTEETDLNGWQITPNPALHLVTVTSKNNPIGSMRLYNIQGQLLSTFVSSGLEFTFEVDHLSSGMYLLEFEVGDARIIEKLMIGN